MSKKQYRFLEVGELIKTGDEWRAHNNSHHWKKSICEGYPVGPKDQNCYRRLISESKPNEETYIPISPDWGEATADIRGYLSGRNRHITIDKSNYRWDGSVDFTKQHCISVSVEEI